MHFIKQVTASLLLYLVSYQTVMAQPESAEPSGTMDAITLLVILIFILIRGLHPR